MNAARGQRGSRAQSIAQKQAAARRLLLSWVRAVVVDAFHRWRALADARAAATRELAAAAVASVLGAASGAALLTAALDSATSNRIAKAFSTWVEGQPALAGQRGTAAMRRAGLSGGAGVSSDALLGKARQWATPGARSDGEATRGGAARPPRATSRSATPDRMIAPTLTWSPTKPMRSVYRSGGVAPLAGSGWGYQFP